MAGVFKVSKEFKAAFDFCMEYYEVRGKELEDEMDRVRENYKEAEQCYLSIAEGLRKCQAKHQHTQQSMKSSSSRD